MTLPVGQGSPNAIPTTRTDATTPSGAVAVPTTGIPAEVKKVLDGLYVVTGINVEVNKEVGGRTIGKAFQDAMADGVITREEFSTILKDFYGFDLGWDNEIEEGAWKAFTGKADGDAGVSITDLARDLKFFQNFRATVTAYSLEWFLNLDDVYVLGGHDIAGQLRQIGLPTLLSGNNPEVRGAWEAAKQLTGGQETDQTWDYFSTILMTKFANTKTLKEFGLDDIAGRSQLVRQLFGEFVIRWATENKTMTPEEWKGLVADAETITQMEARYGSLGDIQVRDAEGLKMLKQMIADFRAGQDITRPIGMMRARTQPTAVPITAR